MNGEANGTPEFDQIIAALRSDGRPEELAGEASTVDAMASALTEVAVPTMHRSPSRVPRIAAMVAASVIGVGGLAAAGAGTLLPSASTAPFDEAPPVSRPPVELPAVATTDAATTTTTEAEEAFAPAIHDDQQAALVPATDDPETEFDETECAEGNHGKTVSSVAHSVEPGPSHGEEVRKAAHSSCGKTERGDDGDEIGPATATDDDDAGAGGHGRPDNPGKGKGQGKGKNKAAGSENNSSDPDD